MASTFGVFKCFVRGLDMEADENDLKRAFSKFGNVIDSKIINDHETGISRGYEFITFEDEKSIRDAIMLMNGDEIDGCSIHVEDIKAKPPDETLSSPTVLSHNKSRTANAKQPYQIELSNSFSALDEFSNQPHDYDICC
ncbi:hypothetical protein EUTSA_v10000466mg [Eutrema salsugineum]|uniref:RRM domain-containing protein n=1 Tax=Eutrema salsugineum TaxID=72664 RepID=V4LQM7_EUTSA|nr:hypothetical protein EUTSA_v10000466mg [Eutrema salsugineum]